MRRLVTVSQNIGSRTRTASSNTIATEKGAVMSNAKRRPRVGGGPMSSPRRRGSNLSVTKERRVLLLDLVHLRQHPVGVVGQELDLGERRAVGGLLHVRVERAVAALVDDELLHRGGEEE